MPGLLVTGMFGGPGDSCYFLHETAYCEEGSVLQFDRTTKALACLPDPCRPANSKLWPDDLPFAPSKDGFCYQFNEVRRHTNLFSCFLANLV